MSLIFRLIMENFLKIKKRKITVLILLIYNQFLFNSYAQNHKGIYSSNTTNQYLQKNNKKIFNKYFAEKNNDDIQNLMKDAIEIEEFIDNTFKKDDIKELDNSKKLIPNINSNYQESNKDVIIDKTNKEEATLFKNNKLSDPINNKVLINNKNSNKESENILPLPSQSIISTSEFRVPPRGYIKLIGPQVTLNLEGADTMNALKLVSKLGKYGIVFLEEENSQKAGSVINSKFTGNFNEADFSDVFNSILLSANLQAVVENKIIYVGKNIINKSLKPKVSKTFRLNQVNAASVADYLSTLGAKISKVMLLSGSIDGQEIGDGYINKKEFKDEIINSYGMEGGPLFGLIGTADLRLQTLTLIGSKDLMRTAEKYIRSLDVRHRQVALTIKMIDVSLTKSDIKNNIFELRTGDTRIINNSGLGLITANEEPINPTTGANVPNIISGGLSNGKFINWLEAKITNENAKILASPTLILGENPNILSSGAASVDDQLSSATIGRPFKNEGFIKVGETVVTGFTQSSNEGGVVTCTAEEGTAGITFGAKLDKIDDNGYVTFALSPAISSVTKSVEISGCGIQNTLSVRKLDTGSIRVRNGDTLILTGVLQDSEAVNTSKVPILGDIPILGSLFRNNATQKRKSELIILVTPKILKDR